MSFFVDPDAVDALACRFADWGQECDLARAYNGDHTGGSNLSEPGLIDDFKATMDSVQASVEQALWQLRMVTVNTAAELFATADYYRGGDAETVARLDATLPSIAPPRDAWKPV